MCPSPWAFLSVACSGDIPSCLRAFAHAFYCPLSGMFSPPPRPLYFWVNLYSSSYLSWHIISSGKAFPDRLAHFSVVACGDILYFSTCWSVIFCWWDY